MQQKPKLKRLITIGNLKAIGLRQTYGFIEVMAWEIILVKHHPILVKDMAFSSLFIPDDYRFFNKFDGVLPFSQCLYRSGGQSESIEIVWLSILTFTDYQERLLDISVTDTALQAPFLSRIIVCHCQSSSLTNNLEKSPTMGVPPYLPSRYSFSKDALFLTL